MTAERDLFEDGDEGEDAQDDSAAGESDGAQDPKSPDKRIRDLQSQKDKETARANKAEKELQRLRAAVQEPDAEDGKPPASAGGDVANDALLDMARMFAYQQNPKLEEYGISQSDLTGSTPSEVAASAVELVARFEKIETRVRNKVLAENGMAPEIDAGAPPANARDFTNMPKEDFNKLVEEAMRGGAR